MNPALQTRHALSSGVRIPWLRNLYSLFRTPHPPRHQSNAQRRQQQGNDHGESGLHAQAIGDGA
jgi:hypothetical protein